MRIKSVLLRSLNYSSINTALKTQHTNTLGYVWNSGGTKVVTDKGCGVLGLLEDSSWAIIEATGCGLGDAVTTHLPAGVSQEPTLPTDINLKGIT